MFNANIIEKLRIKINLVFGRKKSGGSVGILDRGKGTKMYGNTFVGYETAIKEEGKDAEVVENRIIK